MAVDTRSHAQPEARDRRAEDEDRAGPDAEGNVHRTGTNNTPRDPNVCAIHSGRRRTGRVVALPVPGNPLSPRQASTAATTRVAGGMPQSMPTKKKIVRTLSRRTHSVMPKKNLPT